MIGIDSTVVLGFRLAWIMGCASAQYYEIWRPFTVVEFYMLLDRFEICGSTSCRRQYENYHPINFIMWFEMERPWIFI
jgi:hypothetical protein